MEFEIKSRWSGKILFSVETKSLKLAVEAAVEGGADLGGADLSDAYLRGAYLWGADLGGAYLKGAYLWGADLRGAYLWGADLGGADLGGADLGGADLRGAYLRGAYLGGVDLGGADLRGAYLRGAYLGGADLSDAYLKGADGLNKLPYQLQTCPRSGSFEAWKKGSEKSIIKLEIPWFARRTANFIDRKCRAELAIVKAIWDKNGEPITETTNSTYNQRVIIYRVGGFVSSRKFDASWTTDCSRGIHFFMTLEEAENWAL